MKKSIVTLLFLLTSFLGFGQSVSAPDSKSFLPSTTAQDGSGFQLSGFSATSTLLASISLINPSTNTTFYLTTTTGLTAASGFTLSGNKVRLVVTGTMANINNALASLKINTGSVVGNVQISVAATVNPVGYFYNGVNGHFYRPISNGTTYTGARAASLLTTFKGQQGYLVTITSASENAFIFANVPQANVWFAATDEVKDGTWVIDAGPEKGTVMKTSNGQTAGNIPGVYNNWASGEPNGNNGSENYAVTNWNGQPTWNDLSNNWNNPYIIEYGTWTNPDDATFTEFYTNSVTHSNGEVLRASFNVDFGGNVDETKFTARGYTYTNNNWNIVNGTARQLSGLGKVDLTSLLDTAKVSGGGVRATTTTGGVEWCVIYDYEATNQRYRVGIDSREVNGIVSNPSMISSLQLFDLWNGPVTFNSYDSNGWTEVYVYTNTQFNFSGSSFLSNIRSGNGFHALTAEFTFSPIMAYKPHGMELTHSNQTELNTLYNSIVGVSDVYLAFKELADGGIFGNQSGMGLTNGIQYMNADVDGNGVFNESDTYKLLQHLTGVEPLAQSTTLTYLMKLYNKSDYDAITTSNWGTKFNSTRNLIPFTLGGLNNTYNINVTWLGDVNLSHSAQQSVSAIGTNSIRSMSLMTNSVSTEINASIVGEINNDKVIITILLDPLQQAVVGTQFQLNYDNTKLKFEKVDFVTNGNPMNYGTNKGTFINIGSLITGGNGVLDKTTEYKIVFTPINPITNILGLTSISTTDAVNKDGKQLKVKLN
jgi:Lectin C-type domain